MFAFGIVNLDFDIRRLKRYFNTALQIYRRHNVALRDLPNDRFDSIIRRIHISLDIMGIRLRAHAPLTLRGEQPDSWFDRTINIMNQ